MLSAIHWGEFTIVISLYILPIIAIFFLTMTLLRWRGKK
jgi:hypothetical protein